MGFVASQHLDSVRDKFHLQDLSHIGEELLEMSKQALGVLLKLLLNPADIQEFHEDLPDKRTLAKKINMKLREQTKPNALDEDQCEVQRSEDEDGDHDVLHSNVKFASLKEQAHFYGDIPDDDPIDYHVVDVGQGIPEELADGIEATITSAEKPGMSRDVVQSLRQLVTVQGRIQAQAGRRLSCECEAPCHQAARRCRTRADVSSQVRLTTAVVHA
jgi:hypothetical protein